MGNSSDPDQTASKGSHCLKFGLHVLTASVKVPKTISKKW